MRYELIEGGGNDDELGDETKRKARAPDGVVSLQVDDVTANQRFPSTFRTKILLLRL